MSSGSEKVQRDDAPLHHIAEALEEEEAQEEENLAEQEGFNKHDQGSDQQLPTIQEDNGRETRHTSSSLSASCLTPHVERAEPPRMTAGEVRYSFEGDNKAPLEHARDAGTWSKSFRSATVRARNRTMSLSDDKTLELSGAHQCEESNTLRVAAPEADSVTLGFETSNSQLDDEENLRSLARGASSISNQRYVPEATTVQETPLVYAVRAETNLYDGDDKDAAATPQLCLSRKCLMFGSVLCVVVGVIVTVAVIMAGNNESRKPSGLITLSPSMTPSSPPSVSARPSLSPSNDFETVLVELIQSRSPETVFSSSAVAWAVNWMVTDSYTLDFLRENDERLVQRFALATVWFAFGLEASSDRKLRHWMHPIDECTWKNASYSLTPHCTNSFVSGLHLGGTNATGSIPVEITLLSHLTHLELAQNKLTGTIPLQLSSLTSLTRLSLGYNRFNGTIPSELWSLTDLERLTINVNRAMSASTIPSDLSSLTKLGHLAARDVQLAGSIPTGLGSLTALTWLDLRENAGLAGSLPTELGMLSRLRLLDVTGSQLTGTIPTELGLLTRLSYLSLHNSGVNGTIPTEIGLLRMLTALDIGWNRLLEGSIPRQIYTLSQLTCLRLGGGAGGLMMSPSPVMTEIGLLTNLIYLDLSGSYLNGTIPTELALLGESLLELRLGTSRLTGTVPTELALLTQLTHLGLDQGNLGGPIPSQLALLTDLVALDLHGNGELAGTLMTEIGLLLQLSDLQLGGNDLTGTLPTELGLLKKLTSLSLNTNRFSGLVPSELASLTLLRDGLHLETNDLSGRVPDSICADKVVDVIVECEEVECSCCICCCG